MAGSRAPAQKKGTTYNKWFSVCCFSLDDENKPLKKTVYSVVIGLRTVLRTMHEQAREKESQMYTRIFLFDAHIHLNFALSLSVFVFRSVPFSRLLLSVFSIFLSYDPAIQKYTQYTYQVEQWVLQGYKRSHIYVEWTETSERIAKRQRTRRAHKQPR